MSSIRTSRDYQSVIVALAVGGCAAVLVHATYSTTILRDPNPSDFDSFRLGAKLLITGRDPYALIGPDRPYRWPWPIQYPAWSLLPLAPFAALPQTIARDLFGAITAGCLTFAILKVRPQLWPMLLSFPFIFALRRGQWSPLLFAGFLWAPLSVFFPLKPSLGLACFLAKPRWRVVIVGLALVALSFLVLPSWLPEWLHGLPAGETYSPMLTFPVAWCALAALVRWRDPDARLLIFALAVPQVFGFYETLYVFAAASTVRHAMLMVILSYLVPLYQQHFVAIPDGPWKDVSLAIAPSLITGFYLPAVGLILLRRPSSWTMASGDAR